ncbi:hypothetical protein [Pseudomonas sp. MWU16-30323]|uniref:hypothetical protein n=1 Tax=Pseudomonas sp. MWU16-30323 TaxID=2878094 RepID=UPI001CF9C05D|nr:hypothetical protein [Pseudomonas sp. MWU16-30323]
MQTPFRDLLRSQKLKGPTDRGFDLKKWEKAWQSVANGDEQHIYDAGITFNQLLIDIRSATSSHYDENFPGTSLSRMLELYCCLSNRDIAVASEAIKGKLSDGSSIHSLLMENNPAGNPLSGEEVAVGAVDGFQPAIRNCILNINAGVKFSVGKNIIKPINFIKQEALLSNLYSSYEQYFQALVWGDYSYEKTGSEISIQQIASPGELAIEVSNLRKSRSYISTALFSSHPEAIKMLHGRYEYLKVEFKGAHCEKLIIKAIQEASLRLQAENASLVVNAGDAIGSFPDELLQRNVDGKSFCLKEALEVLRHLSLIAKQMASRTMRYDADIFNTNQMLNYIAQISRKDLIASMCRATGFSSSKTREVIDFICFSGAPKQDLWSHPIIETRKGKLSFILAAAASPIMQRVLEHWLAECFSNDDIKEKGKVYEEVVCSSVNEIISANKLITSFSPAISTTIGVDGREEEIDLLVRIGSIVLVGELKCFVTSDNPRSHFRSREKLEFGAVQAKRKSFFVKENLKLVFDQAGWDFQSDVAYTVLPLVVSNNKMLSGFPIQEIPVVDLTILRGYLGKNTFPLISYYDNELEETVTAAMYRLYDDFEQLQNNLLKFLLLPPAIEGECENFISRPTRIPGTNYESQIIKFTRLVYSELSGAEIKLSRSKNFPVEKLPRYDELINTFHTLC